ncbi:hypothetical protein RQP46_010741 [Phenoliferia psychrophenolica]
MLKYMQHPQTHLNSRRYSRCNKKGRCAYGFPHPVTPRSVIGEDGKVKFRRRYEDSAWTATIVPALLLEWDGHLHADALFTSKVFIYAFKYLYKGPDEANVRLTDSRDKSSPDDFFNARYLSACEAAWRIFAFNIVKKEPSVSSLSVHLPDQQRVQYHRNAGSSSVSDLIRYLELRPRTEPFLSMTYVQYFEAVSFAPFNPSNPLPPQHHLELQSRDPNVRRNIVKLRTRGDHVARLQTIPPGRGEPFYLRAILQHGAATSWDDLYSHEGVRHQSFAEKAVALGLFRDENEAQYAMREAIEHLNTPAQGRFLFANLILEGAEPSELWREFEEWLSSDYLDSTRDAATAHRKTLLSINALFVEHGKSCASFGLPQPDDYSKEVEVELEAFLHQRVALQHRAADMEADFNDGQRAVYHRIIHHIEHSQSTGALIFLEAKAGCGKTFVMQALAAGLRGSGEIVLITGSTALAASLHTRGRTMHNLFKVPVSEDNSNIRCNIERGSTRADLLLAGIVYIMDDIAMSNRAVVEAVDELMRRLTGIDRPMGGKVVVALGDFQQVGPVVKHGGISATVDASIKSSYLWDSFEVLHLLERVRNADDPEYADFVDAVGADTSGARIDLTPFLAHSPSLGEALDHLYPREVLLDAKLCLDRSWLSPHNVHNEIKELDEPLLQAPTLEYVESLKENGIPPHVLHLKPDMSILRQVGAICVIMRNLSIERGLVKNAKVVVTARHRHLIEVLLLNRDGGDETTHLLPRINFSFSPDWHNFTVLRRQFPLRLAYASTFNSCQGQTIGRLMLDFRSEPFSHGQLYTALSRVRNRNDAMVYIPGDDGLTAERVRANPSTSHRDADPVLALTLSLPLSASDLEDMTTNSNAPASMLTLQFKAPFCNPGILTREGKTYTYNTWDSLILDKNGSQYSVQLSAYGGTKNKPAEFPSPPEDAYGHIYDRAALKGINNILVAVTAADIDIRTDDAIEVDSPAEDITDQIRWPTNENYLHLMGPAFPAQGLAVGKTLRAQFAGTKPSITIAVREYIVNGNSLRLLCHNTRNPLFSTADKFPATGATVLVMGTFCGTSGDTGTTPPTPVLELEARHMVIWQGNNATSTGPARVSPNKFVSMPKKRPADDLKNDVPANTGTATSTRRRSQVRAALRRGGKMPRVEEPVAADDGDKSGTEE